MKECFQQTLKGKHRDVTENEMFLRKLWLGHTSREHKFTEKRTKRGFLAQPGRAVDC